MLFNWVPLPLQTSSSLFVQIAAERKMTGLDRHVHVLCTLSRVARMEFLPSMSEATPVGSRVSATSQQHKGTHPKIHDCTSNNHKKD